VDLTADADSEEDEQIDAEPATPSPNVSDMETDEEADLFASPGIDDTNDSGSNDGFQHV